MKRSKKTAAAFMAAVTAAVMLAVPSGAAGKSAFTKTEAEKYDDMYGISVGDEKSGGCIGWIEDGDWTAYKSIDFGKGASKFSVNTSAISAAGTDCGKIELHLDSKDGTLIGSCGITGTGSWSEWKNYSCKVSGASGVHDLYLVYKGSKSNSGYLFNVNYFGFTAATDSGSGTAGKAEVSYFSLTLKKGATAQLGAILTAASDESVKWTTSKSSVASVTQKGKITAKAKGSAIITAKLGDSSIKIKIIVTA